MATDAENLATVKTNLISALLTISANPKPNYSIDGQSISHADYVRMLLQSIKDTQDAIVAIQGPYQVTSYGRP